MSFYEIDECPATIETDHGPMTLLDAIAAGEAWVLLEGGPFPLPVWCVVEGDGSDATYCVKTCSDGFFFNRDPDEEPWCEIHGTEEDGLDVVEDGGYYPELDGTTVRLTN